MKRSLPATARRGRPASRRSSASAELTQPLQDAVSRPERIEFALERWLAWQAPETAARYTLRLALLLLGVSTLAAVVVTTLTLAAEGTGGDVATRLGLATAFLVVSCADVFLLGLLY